MEYTLFFSYQSDTKLDFKFIRDVLNKDVKTKLSSKGIDLIIDYGMRGTPGNPDLLETMLKKGEDCDIFLADLTYVAKFTNSGGTSKYVPNPNVMLELGHAWNFQGKNNTIFVQNTSKGESKDLPVDLKGFRFPISYKLEDEHSEINKKKTREDLSQAFVEAIETVVDSIKEGNRNKYNPFEQFSSCQLHNNNDKFIITKYFEEISHELKKRLETSKCVILEGKNGCGKSKMIKEFISCEYSEQKRNNILYCKYTQTNISELCGKIKDFKNKDLRRDSLLIIDNCDDSAYKEINSILYDSQHKCIFIMDSTQVKINVLAIDNKAYINDVIAQKNVVKSDIIDECGYNLEHIIRKLNGEEYTPNKYNLDAESEKLVEYLSLFSKVGYRQCKEDEFCCLCENFNIDKNNGFILVNQLIKNGFVVKVGGFIYIDSDAVANEYVKDIWNSDIASELIFNDLIGQGHLALWFINRQVQVLEKNKECKSFLKNIIVKNFREISFVDSTLGEDVIDKLVRLYPKEVLSSLEILCSNNIEYEFKKNGSLLYTLDIIAKEKNLFERVIDLFLVLSESTKYKEEVKEVIAGYFMCMRYSYNPNISLESFKKLYKEGHIDIIKSIYASIFNVAYKNISDEQKKYLSDMYFFLISIREENKDWANNVIVNNIIAARYLGISIKVYAEITKIALDSEIDINVAELLSKNIRRVSGKDKRSIKGFLERISKKSCRNMIYVKVVLFNNDTLSNSEGYKSAMNDIAIEILQNKDWENSLDVLLRGRRKYYSNSFWFGYAVFHHYNDCESLINKCLDLYNEIPIEEQSYDFFRGLFHYYVDLNDFSKYKEERDKLLKSPQFINIALALSNGCENNFSDLISIRNALTTNSLSLKRIEELNFIYLTKSEYCEFSFELINSSREGADVGIRLLTVAKDQYEEIDISHCLNQVVKCYDYWTKPDIKFDSAYERLIELLIYTLNKYSSDELAFNIIKSLIKGSNSREFNKNCSVVNLFKVLIKNFQIIFLRQIELVIFGDSLTSLSSHNLEKLFMFKHDADNQIYLNWCNEKGASAANFVSKFIPLMSEDERGDLIWTDEAKILMNKYSKVPYVLNNISARLFNGEISVAKYSKLKTAYDKLIDDNNRTIGTWATKQAEFMESQIQDIKERAEREKVWNK